MRREYLNNVTYQRGEESFFQGEAWQIIPSPSDPGKHHQKRGTANHTLPQRMC